jgi:hypothetical protein
MDDSDRSERRHPDGVEMSRYLYRLATDPLDQRAKSYTYCAGLAPLQFSTPNGVWCRLRRAPSSKLAGPRLAAPACLHTFPSHSTNLTHEPLSRHRHAFSVLHRRGAA